MSPWLIWSLCPHRGHACYLKHWNVYPFAVKSEHVILYISTDTVQCIMHSAHDDVDSWHSNLSFRIQWQPQEGEGGWLLKTLTYTHLHQRAQRTRVFCLQGITMSRCQCQGNFCSVVNNATPWTIYNSNNCFVSHIIINLTFLFLRIASSKYSHLDKWGRIFFILHFFTTFIKSFKVKVVFRVQLYSFHCTRQIVTGLIGRILSFQWEVLQTASVK